MDGHLGQLFLSQYNITMDFHQSRAWFTKTL
jgi:hypothetical protein